MIILYIAVTEQLKSQYLLYITQKITAMKINFLTVLQDSFTQKSYQILSKNIAISTEQSKNGVHVIIPIILVSILENHTARNAIQPIWWNSLKKEYACKDDKTINIDIIDKPFYAVKGRGVSWYIFRNCYNDIAEEVSKKAFIRKDNAEFLIQITTPLIAGYLINWLEREGWKFEDLIENLLKTKYDLIAALPVGISPAHLGVSGIFFG